MIRHCLLLVVCVLLVSGVYASVIPDSSTVDDFQFGAMPSLPMQGDYDYFICQGHWFDPNCWSYGILPGPGTSVEIDSPYSALLNFANAEIENLVLAGGGLEISGAGLTVDGTLTVKGWLDLEGGLSVGENAMNSGTIQAFGGDATVVGNFLNSGSLDLEGSSLWVYGNFVNASGNVTVPQSMVEVLGNFINSGTMDLENPNPVSYYNIVVGGNVINSGSMTSSANMSVAGNFINSGTMNFATPNLDPGWNLLVSGNVINSGSMTINSSDLIISGSVVNSGAISLISTYEGSNQNLVYISGSLTNASTGSFSLNSGSDIVTAASVINQGSMFIGGGSAMTVTGGPTASGSALAGFLNAGIVNIAQNGNLTVVGNYTQTMGQTTLDGNLQILAGGTAIFAGGSLYGNQGTVNGSVTSNASINLGDQLLSVGQLSFLGNYTQGPHGSLTFDIAGAAPGQYDQLNIGGHAQLNGLMTVNLLGGFLPQLGNTFDIMNFSSSSGTFSMVVGLPINGQEHFVLEYDPTDLTLDVVAGALSGPNSTAGFAAGKNSSEPFIALTEPTSSLVATNSTAMVASSTPEPGSMILLGSGLLCVAYAWRRRMSK